MYKAKKLGFGAIYHPSVIEEQKKRYDKAAQAYHTYFTGVTGGELRFFSAPGRTEVGGNHTDHNNGKVLAASVNLDVIAAVEPIPENRIIIKSEGYSENNISLDSLDPAPGEAGRADALVRGVARGFADRGYKLGGFRAYTTSRVLGGSGLSSSAAFEVLVGTILSHLYNDGAIDPVKLAQIAQFSENKFFGKPCGLLDQMACAVGGFVAIDFRETNSPIVEKIDVDFNSFGHSLCIIDTKGSHASLTHEYAAIPGEMKAVAGFFDVDCLRRISRKDILLNIKALRHEFGDRAVLRALHFFNENDRVDKLTHALREPDFDHFLQSINESGNSSFKYLQNIYSSAEPTIQPLAIGLNVAESALHRKGASRVHGGGFAGTIQAFVPHELLKEFKMSMENVFGADTCHILTIRQHGGVEVVMDE